MTFSEKAINYYLNLNSPKDLSGNVNTLNPYEKEEVKTAVKKFYTKYFNDSNKRIFIWGINPGRFGGGLTGIAFTDPAALREYCGIDNSAGTKRELSSRFIYEMISAFGGAEKFYSKCYLTALYPLALIKDDKNYNYYDEPGLYQSLKPEIESSFINQTNFGADKKLAVCLGRKNFIYLTEMNNKFNYFERIEILEHPRYIMQYKSKTKDDYIRKYISVLNSKSDSIRFYSRL
ncbi:MAG: DUF4918 family protein [Ignavibacteriaceae bacterium]